MSIFSLNYNAQSAITQQHLNSNETALQKAVRRLNTGNKYNVSQDNPASYSILEKMRTTLGASVQGVTNAENGNSLLDTADSAMANIERIFRDVAVLAEDSANGVWTNEQRTVFNAQAEHLLTVADTISQATNFLGSPLLDGSFTELSLQIGINKDEVDIIRVEMPNMRTNTLTQGMTTPSGDAINLGTQQDALDSVANVNSILRGIEAQRARVGSQQNSITLAITNRKSMNEETSSTISTIGDADIAQEMENFTNYTAKVQATQYMFSLAMGNPAKLTQLMQAI